MPDWVPAIETKPAPMPLLLVQSFVNTSEADVGTDLLADPASGARLVERAGILPDLLARRAGTGARSRHQGEHPFAARAQCGRRGAHRRGPAAPGTVSPAPRASARSLAQDGLVSLEPVPAQVCVPMATLLLVVRDAQRDGSWTRLKACRNTDCQLGLLRPVARSTRGMVRHGGVREQDQEPQPAIAPVDGRQLNDFAAASPSASTRAWRRSWRAPPAGTGRP